MIVQNLSEIKKLLYYMTSLANSKIHFIILYDEREWTDSQPFSCKQQKQSIGQSSRSIPLRI